MGVNGEPQNHKQLVCTNHNVVHRSEVVPTLKISKRKQFRLRDRIWIYSKNQDLFQKSLLSLTLENHKHSIDSHCKNFNSLILSCHT